MLDLNSELINSKTNVIHIILTKLLESPLHLAVKRNQIKIIELLIRNHVDESLKDLVFSLYINIVGENCKTIGI